MCPIWTDFGSLLRSLNAGRASKLTVTTANGKLKVCLEESFNKKSDVQPGAKSTKRIRSGIFAILIPFTCLSTTITIWRRRG